MEDTEIKKSKNNTENSATEDIRLMLPEDIDWPVLLNHIPEPPKRLFIRGHWPPRFPDGKIVSAETKFLCVVGARKHSVYGREACETLITGLKGYDICIVSGLALGIDAVAHESALSSGIPTIAFPGSGLEQSILYPPRNFRLAKRIMDAGGTLLSEFDTDAPAMPWFFPQRNRLMAGISHATLVVEAKCPSGTLITSSLANDYGRDVFAVPGDIFSPLSAGPHMLINRGAALIKNSDDILHELGIKIRVDAKNAKNTKNPSKNRNDSGQKQLFEDIRGDTEQEKALYKIILDAGGKILKDDLIRSYSTYISKHPAQAPQDEPEKSQDKNELSEISKVSSALTLMEIAGIIREKNGMIHIVHSSFRFA